MDSSDDNIPLARLKEQWNENEMNSEEDIAETESGSEFLLELCGVKRCKLEADNECDKCNIALCSEHFKTTTCQNNYKPEVKIQENAIEKSNNDFTSAASDPILVGKVDLEKLLDDRAEQLTMKPIFVKYPSMING